MHHKTEQNKTNIAAKLTNMCKLRLSFVNYQQPCCQQHIGMCWLVDRPSAGITSAISKFSAAAQLGSAPGAGSGALSISDDERRRILDEEQRQLDILKVSVWLVSLLYESRKGGSVAEWLACCTRAQKGLG